MPPVFFYALNEDVFPDKRPDLSLGSGQPYATARKYNNGATFQENVEVGQVSVWGGAGVEPA